jgi:hypothetical protein
LATELPPLADTVTFPAEFETAREASASGLDCRSGVNLHDEEEERGI